MTKFFSPQEYGAPLNLALTISTLIWCIVKISRFHYSSSDITKLTLRPYWIVLGQLCWRLLQDICYCIDYSDSSKPSSFAFELTVFSLSMQSMFSFAFFWERIEQAAFLTYFI